MVALKDRRMSLGPVPLLLLVRRRGPTDVGAGWIVRPERWKRGVALGLVCGQRARKGVSSVEEKKRDQKKDVGKKEDKEKEKK